MSILANGSLNAIRGIKNNFVRLVLKLFLARLAVLKDSSLRKVVWFRSRT